MVLARCRCASAVTSTVMPSPERTVCLKGFSMMTPGRPFELRVALDRIARMDAHQ
jgi:hypothetical protein